MAELDQAAAAIRKKIPRTYTFKRTAYTRQSAGKQTAVPSAQAELMIIFKVFGDDEGRPA